MKSKAGAVPTLAFLIWASAADASETIWEGAVRVVDAKTLAGVPDGPLLSLGGIEPPPSDAKCGPAVEKRACRELAVQALRDVITGQKLVCEQDGDEVACRTGDIDIAEWMVRMGWAIATDERLRETEREAHAAARGMWYEEERFAHAHEATPGGSVPPSLPGEDAVQACAKGRANAFAQREYGNLMAIEAIEWLIEETRLRWERRNTVDGDVVETTIDAKTREALNSARKLCGVLGSAPGGSGAPGDLSEEEIQVIESKVERLAYEARETCWEAAVGAARAERVEDLTRMRQIARHTMLRTGWLGERLWQAKEQGNDEEARRRLRQASLVFESAERKCNELAQE